MKGKKLIAGKSELEKEKIELIKLRIRNKFYERGEVLENVVNTIIQKEIRKIEDTFR